MRTLIALLLGLSVSACSTPTGAGGLIDVQIVSRSTGLPLPTYQHRGKTWVVGTPGEAYTLRMVNRSGARVLAVGSVDGINVITGETAAHDQSGYVLSPWGSADVRGWRKSMEEVAQFYFTALPDSYAARTDRPGNVGVIGVAAFREVVEPPPVLPEPLPYSQSAPKAAAPAARDSASGAAQASEERPAAARGRREAEKLGTGHGAREHAPTSHTEFRRASAWPAQTVKIYYDSAANLQAFGVIPRPRRYADPNPDPFPGQFAPDPRG
jgi:hypothetical protein